jgi:hypothetical protein
MQLDKDSFIKAEIKNIGIVDEIQADTFINGLRQLWD